MIQDYSLLSRILKSKTYESPQELISVIAFWNFVFGEINCEFVSALLQDSSRFCIREVVKYAATDTEASKLFSSLLPLFPPIPKNEYEEVC